MITQTRQPNQLTYRQNVLLILCLIKLCECTLLFITILYVSIWCSLNLSHLLLGFIGKDVIILLICSAIHITFSTILQSWRLKGKNETETQQFLVTWSLLTAQHEFPVTVCTVFDKATVCNTAVMWQKHHGLGRNCWHWGKSLKE